MSEQHTKSYNPRDHLVKIKTRDGLKDYYPAAWRLYELNLRYPNANFQSQIIHMDMEHNFVIVKCTLYLGQGDLEMAERRTEAMKGGLLSQLDKVETAAKARCARDLGISTELALDITDDEEPVDTASEESTPVVDKPAQPDKPAQTSSQLEKQVRNKLNDLYVRAKKLGLCTSDKQFIMYIRRTLSNPHLDLKYVTLATLVKVEDDLLVQEMAVAINESGEQSLVGSVDSAQKAS